MTSCYSLPRSGCFPAIVAIPVVAAIVAFGAGKALNNKGEDQSVFFDPDRTDVMDYVGFRFGREHADGETLTVTWSKLFPKLSIGHLNFDDADGEGNVERAVNIMDARKNTSLSFEENGFTLIDLSSSGRNHDNSDNNNSSRSISSYYEPSNWEDPDQMRHFHSTAMVPELKNLFPNATRFEVRRNGRVRGKWFREPPIVNGIHSDILIGTNTTAILEGDAINSSKNKRDGEVLDAVVTVWKPVEMKGGVCDKPLALLDASTYLQEDQRPYLFRVRLWPFVEKDNYMIGVPIHKPKSHKWYYYPFMKTNEVLLFTQYDRRKGFFTVPHGAFVNPNCPPGAEPRWSYNYRVWVYTSSTEDGRQTVVEE